MADLPKGLYEQLISQALQEALALLDAHGLAAVRKTLDPVDSHELLTRHVTGALQHVLRGLPEKNRLEEQVRICNEILHVLRSKHMEAVPAGEEVHSPAEALLAVLPARATPARETEVLPRPHVPLSASDLLVNARGEPAVGHALDREIPSADQVDLLCAFVRWNGLRLLLPRLREHCAQGRPLRVITTTYTGTTNAARSTSSWRWARRCACRTRRGPRASTPRHGCSIARRVSRRPISGRRT